MSLKTDRKSNRNKPWIASRKSSGRRLRISYHLIVTEGTKTEPAYFNGLKRAINVADGMEKVHLDIIGTGTNTTGLISRAKSLVRNAGNPYRHVWLVYDKDDFPTADFNSVVDLCLKETRVSGEVIYHAIWSNQCIELWFLLHFIYLNTDIHRSEYYTRLSKYLEQDGLGKYTKNRDDIFTVLLPKIRAAIENAEKLEIVNNGKTPSQSAPGTMVHAMMKEFLPYL